MQYSSNNLLDSLYAQTETWINIAVTTWQLLPARQLLAMPGVEQWSATQCLEHLNSYGRYYLPAIEKAIKEGGTSKAALHFKSGILGNYFYKLMLAENNGLPKKKMSAPKAHRPGDQLDAAKVMDEFITQLEQLEMLITRSREVDINKVKVAISIAPFIRLKLGDIFLFYTAHIGRHMNQAERALNKVYPHNNPLSSKQRLNNSVTFIL